jgi:hypothetical protein
MINFQNEMLSFAEFTHLEIFIFIQQKLTQKCDLLGQLYVFLIRSCKRFHSKILSYEKVEKSLKMIHNPFIK